MQWQEAIVSILCLIANKDYLFSGFRRRHLWLAWRVIIVTKSFWLAKSAKNASKCNQFSLCIYMQVVSL